MAANAIDVRDITAARKHARAAGPAARKELDGQLRKIGNDVAIRARGLTPRKSGRLAAGWKPSVTYRLGVAIRNPVVYAGQHEYGRQVWLRRGFPFSDSDGRPPSAPAGNLPTRWVNLPGGRMVQEAHYLIPRSAPGKRASIEVVAHSTRRIENALAGVVDRVF